MSWCEQNLGVVCMYVYVYKDCNFGSIRISHVCAYAQKWLEHLASATSSIQRKLWSRAIEQTCFYLNFLMVVYKVFFSFVISP